MEQDLGWPSHGRLVPGHSLVEPAWALVVAGSAPHREGLTGEVAPGSGWLWLGAIRGHLPRREGRGVRASSPALVARLEPRGRYDFRGRRARF